MIIEHSKLFAENPADPTAHFRYSNEVEAALAKLLGMTNINQPVGRNGYHPEYDFQDLDTGLTFEVKCQFRKPDEYLRFIKVEYKQSSNSRPSGIELSTADYWIFITRDTNAGADIGKVRAYKRETLETLYEYFKDGSIRGQYNYFHFDPWNGVGYQHIWLGDIAATVTPNTFDLTKWVRKGYPLQSGFIRPKRAPSRNPFPGRTDNI